MSNIRDFKRMTNRDQLTVVELPVDELLIEKNLCPFCFNSVDDMIDFFQFLFERNFHDQVFCFQINILMTEKNFSLKSI